MVGVLSLALAAMAASPVAKVRVLDVTAYGEDKLQDDAGIVSAATLSLAEDPQLFPAIESMVIKVGKDSVNYSPDSTVPVGWLEFSGSIGETEPFEFISIPKPNEVGKFDAAIVGRDGKVAYLDEPIVIDYRLRTITTVKPLSIKDGDTLLVFVKTSDPITPDKRETQLDRYNEQPTTPLTNVAGEHGGEGGGRGGGN
jgi:hypothetical protein